MTKNNEQSNKRTIDYNAVSNPQKTRPEHGPVFETVTGENGIYTIEHATPDSEQAQARIIYWKDGSPEDDFAIPEEAFEAMSALQLHRMLYHHERAVDHRSGSESNKVDETEHKTWSGVGLFDSFLHFLDDRTDQLINSIVEEVQGEVRNPDMAELRERRRENSNSPEDDQEKDPEKKAQDYKKELRKRGYCVEQAFSLQEQASTSPESLYRTRLEKELLRSLRRIASIQQAFREDGGDESEDRTDEAFAHYHNHYEARIIDCTQELKMRQIDPMIILEVRAKNNAEAEALKHLHDQLYGPAAQQPENVKEKREEKTDKNTHYKEDRTATDT